MTATDIGCPLDTEYDEDTDTGGCGLFDTSADLTAHLSDVHGTDYERATGSTLSQDECDALGLDGRDGTGEYTLADLSDAQRVALYEYRNAVPDDGLLTPRNARGADDPRDAR